jgi:tetratricopeptide (TPR) repeat protein
MELQEGLTDIETALKSEGNRDNAEFLDTRGYLLYLLDRNEEALKDLDRALKLSEQARNAFIFQQNPFGRRGPIRSRAEQEENDHSLAVMYHHRGLIHEKLGHKEQAEEDLQHGKDLGYAPEKGVL